MNRVKKGDIINGIGWNGNDFSKKKHFRVCENFWSKRTID
jgi:hypothetical protein